MENEIITEIIPDVSETPVEGQTNTPVLETDVLPPAETLEEIQMEIQFNTLCIPKGLS